MKQARFKARHYVMNAVFLVRENTLILWWTVFLAGCHAATSVLQSSTFRTPISITVFALSVVAAPVIYGIYFELIRGTYSSIPKIAAKYITPYIWLLLRMYLPALFVAGLPMVLFPEHAGGGYFHLILISFSLLYLYVIPYFYLSGRQHGAITSGIQFLVNHLSESTPLIMTIFLTEACMLITQYFRASLGEVKSVALISIDFASFVLASIIDFIVFIILIHVLQRVIDKEKKDVGSG